MKKFNPRESAFIKYRARGESLVNSIMKAGYKAKSRLIASSYGCQLEKKLNIIEAIELEKLNIFDMNTINPEYVLVGLKNIAEGGKIEANKVRSYELIGKYLAMFSDKVEISQTEQDTNQFSLERLSRIRQASTN